MLTTRCLEVIVLLEFNDIDNNTVIEADICIIGAGAAGIAMGRELAKTSYQVCILESGGLNYEPEIQQLNQGIDQGLDVQPAISRLRMFGGTTNHWEGQCTPLIPIDFSERDWIDNSGWPITYEDLMPYYHQAQEILRLGPFEYGQTIWEALQSESPFNNSDKLETFFLPLCPKKIRNFGLSYRDEAEFWSNINIYLHATATNVATTQDNQHVTHIDVTNIDGKKAKVKAHKYILATGAIANARIMLYSNQINPDGIGNEHDNVGRYFMQHPHVDIAEIVPDDKTDRETLDNILGGKQLPEEKYQGVITQVGLRLSSAQQKQEKVLNGSLICRKGASFDSPQHLLVAMAKRLKRGELPDRFLDKLWYLLKNSGELAEFIPEALREGIEPALKKTTSKDSILVQARIEQSPSRESRIMLSNEKDSLGLPGLVTKWQLNELDRRSMKILATKLGIEVGRRGLGRLRFAEWFQNFDIQDNSPANWHPGMWGGFHHMGTTRMSDDPTQGVVDHNCKVHNMDNLFIAGSSVFTTSGYANPTLTLLALSYRLVDHLKGTLQPKSA